jgi:hypothetical protein
MAAAIVLLVGIGFQYNQLDQTTNQVVNATLRKLKLKRFKSIRIDQQTDGN